MITILLAIWFLTQVHAQPLSDLNLESLKKSQSGTDQNKNQVPKNPFLPAVQSLSDVSIQDLILAGIIRGDNDEEQWALVNGQIIAKGEKLAGYDVAEIKDNAVVLKQGELTYELKLSGI